MYDLMPIIFGGLMILLGLYMTINPKNATKKELRNDDNVVKKTKKNGFIEILCGIVVIILGIMLKNLG